MLGRHSLVWLTDEGWQAALQARAQSADAAVILPALRAWCDVRLPLIVRRADRASDASPSSTLIPLGLPLPPEPSTGIKPRIALYAAAAHVLRHLPPPLLHETLPQAPTRWQAALADLCNAAAAQGMTLRVFGSLAWQHLTGKPYVTATSDIDLLWQPADRAALDGGIALLAHHAQSLPLDGEIVFPQDRAVSWKEWRQVAAHRQASGAQLETPLKRVLVKSPYEVCMMPVAILHDSMDSMGERTCTP